MKARKTGKVVSITLRKTDWYGFIIPTGGKGNKAYFDKSKCRDKKFSIGEGAIVSYIEEKGDKGWFAKDVIISEEKIDLPKTKQKKETDSNTRKEKPPADIKYGVVKKILEEKKFGFIQLLQEGENSNDIIFFLRDVELGKKLEEQDIVSFQLINSEKGARASKINIIKDQPSEQDSTSSPNEKKLKTWTENRIRSLLRKEPDEALMELVEDEDALIKLLNIDSLPTKSFIPTLLSVFKHVDSSSMAVSEKST